MSSYNQRVNHQYWAYQEPRVAERREIRPGSSNERIDETNVFFHENGGDRHWKGQRIYHQQGDSHKNQSPALSKTYTNYQPQIPRPPKPRHSYAPNEGRMTKNKSREQSPIQSNLETEMQDRFKEIESIFGEENENLKRQKQYLLEVIQKMRAKEKEYKSQIRNYKQTIETLKSQNTVVKQKYEQAREFIANGIGKIEETVHMKSIQNSPGNKTNLPSDTTSSMNISDALEELSDKFDALMFEYQKTKDPELRKKCIEITREIKRLKKNHGISIYPHQQI